MSLKCNSSGTNLDVDVDKNLFVTKSRPMSKNKSLRQAFREIYLDFCANTSIHGFQYFGQQRPRTEIFFWIGIFIVSIYFCSSIIWKIYVKWDETPVIVSFSEKSTPLWNIPFPAVTICSQTKRAKNATDPSFMELIQKLLINETQDSLSNITSKEFAVLLTLNQICQTTFTSSRNMSQPAIDYIEELNGMLPDFQTHYMQCTWFGLETECEKLFTKVYTDDGVCYTFNSLTATDLYREETFQYQEAMESLSNNSETRNLSLTWSLEQGFEQGCNLHTYPARVLSSGSKYGLEVYLQFIEDEMDYSCSGPSQGYKVLLHSPDDVATVSKHFIRLGVDKETLIAVKPKMITTSADLAAYQPRKRQCYLNKDRQLKFYKVYSQNNCEREYLTNFTLSQCGCVKFTMPRTPDMPVCDGDQISCYTQARHQLLLKQFSDGLQNPDSASADATECNCMPACTSLEYETEISEGNYDIEKTFKSLGALDQYYSLYPGGKMSQIVIYFKDNQFITSRRSELYGLTELLANFGGVCGLFMGISILSIIEMLYHFTLRLWSNVTGPRPKVK